MHVSLDGFVAGPNGEMEVLDVAVRLANCLRLPAVASKRLYLYACGT
jgi:hypothetical protein